MISQMTCIQNQIVNHSLDSPAHNRALKNGHIIFFWVIHLECLPNRFIIHLQLEHPIRFAQIPNPKSRPPQSEKRDNILIFIISIYLQYPYFTLCLNYSKKSIAKIEKALSSY